MKILKFALLLFCFNSTLQAQVRKISDSVELLPLTSSIYRHVSYQFMKSYGNVPANGLIVTDGKQAIMIDTPWTNEQTETLVRFLQDSLDLNLKAVIVGHWHNDCMGGLDYLHNIGVTSFSSKLTQVFADSAKLPFPQIGFTDSLTILLNDKKLECRYLGGGHTKDNIVVWIPHEKVLFGGCLVKSFNSKTLGYTYESDMENWPKTLNNLQNVYPNFNLVVPGHGTPGGMELITHTLELLQQNAGR